MPKRIVDLNATLEVYDCLEEMNEDDRSVLIAAKFGAEHSYSPYSNFKVGAAVLLANGELVSGSNQENIAYPSGLCGESISIFSASNRFPDIPIIALAVTTISGVENCQELITPCGVCRQVIAEYEMRYQQEIRIVMQGKAGKIFIASSNKVLLPLMFDHPQVKKNG